MFKLRAMPQNRLPGPGLPGPSGAANALALDFSNLSSSILVGGEHPDSCRPGPGAARACGRWAPGRDRAAASRGAGRKVVGRLEGVGLPNVESPLAGVL